MKKKKIIISFIVILLVIVNFTYVNANILQDIFSQGGNWLSPDTTDRGLNDVAREIAENLIMGDLRRMVRTIGNFIFFVAAAFLGLKYLWSGVAGKTDVKQTLPTFVVGATFFYCANIIFSVLYGDFYEMFVGNVSFMTISGRLWGTITVLVQVLAITGVIAIGIKYMISSADAKADIKKDLLPIVIGLIMIFSLTSFLNFIVGVGAEVLKYVRSRFSTSFCTY